MNYIKETTRNCSYIVCHNIILCLTVLSAPQRDVNVTFLTIIHAASQKFSLNLLKVKLNAHHNLFVG